MGRRCRHLNPVHAGAVLYLDARRIQGVADNAAISAWDNLGSAGGTTSQGTSGYRPLYRTVSGMNGTPCVSFDGTDDFLRLDIEAGALAYVSVVGSISSVGGSFAGLINLRDTNSTLVPDGVLGPLLETNDSDPNEVVEWGVTVTSGTLNGASFTVSDLAYPTGLSLAASAPLVFNLAYSFSSLGSGTGYCCIGRSSFQAAGAPRALGGYISRMILSKSVGPSMARRLDHAAAYSFKLPCS